MRFALLVSFFESFKIPYMYHTERFQKTKECIPYVSFFDCPKKHLLKKIFIALKNVQMTKKYSESLFFMMFTRQAKKIHRINCIHQVVLYFNFFHIQSIELNDFGFKSCSSTARAKVLIKHIKLFLMRRYYILYFICLTEISYFPWSDKCYQRYNNK